MQHRDINNYLHFFGLREEPFSNAPVTKFYYESEQHEMALVRLLRVMDQMKGLALLIGEIGAGKTTLARRLLAQLPEDEFEASMMVIIHSGISAEWLLRRVAQQLGVPNPAHQKLQILGQVYRRLLQLAQNGKKAVILIDEAQMLESRELMEEFRGLLNLEVPERKLLSFVFFGLPELEDHLKLDPPLAQRVGLRVRLGSLDPLSASGYVTHRMSLAGAKERVFTDEALTAIHRFSDGYPRVINTICDNALFEACLLNRKTIDDDLIVHVSNELGLVHPIEIPKNSQPKESSLIQENPLDTQDSDIDEITEQVPPADRTTRVSKKDQAKPQEEDKEEDTEAFIDLINEEMEGKAKEKSDEDPFPDEPSIVYQRQAQAAETKASEADIDDILADIDQQVQTTG